MIGTDIPNIPGPRKILFLNALINLKRYVTLKSNHRSANEGSGFRQATIVVTGETQEETREAEVLEEQMRKYLVMARIK